jgi:hypothetical protein
MNYFQRSNHSCLYMLAYAGVLVLDALVIILSLGFVCSNLSLRFCFWHLERYAEKYQREGTE